MPSDDTPSDAELLRAAASKDRTAFETFVSRHQASLFRFCQTLTRDRDAAEDALQETLLTAWRKAGTFRGDGSARSWLFTIARRKIYRAHANRLGAEAVETTDLETLAGRAGWGAEASQPTQGMEGMEEHILLEELFDKLPPGDREVLLLRELEGFSAEEAARLMSVGVPAFKSRLHRARLRALSALREGHVHAR